MQTIITQTNHDKITKTNPKWERPLAAVRRYWRVSDTCIERDRCCAQILTSVWHVYRERPLLCADIDECLTHDCIERDRWCVQILTSVWNMYRERVLLCADIDECLTHDCIHRGRCCAQILTSVWRMTVWRETAAVCRYWRVSDIWLYWAVQAGLLTPLPLTQHRLSPLLAFTSGVHSTKWKAVTVNLRSLQCQF